MPTRKQVDGLAINTMQTWLLHPDRGAAKYAAIDEPYTGLLDLLDRITDALQRQVAGRDEAGKNAFFRFLKRAFRTVRWRCRAVENADLTGDLAEAVDFVDAAVNADEAAVRWLFERLDPGEMTWNQQFAGKTYASCLKIAAFAGPLYASGYHTDRAFIEHGGVPRNAPKTADKLHLSIDPLSFGRVRDKVLPLLVRAGYTHKIVADDADLMGWQKGKVVTIYPKIVDVGGHGMADATDLAAMADLLSTWLATLGLLHGPPIQGETPWKGSRFVYLEKDAKLRG